NEEETTHSSILNTSSTTVKDDNPSALSENSYIEDSEDSYEHVYHFTHSKEFPWEKEDDIEFTNRSFSVPHPKTDLPEKIRHFSTSSSSSTPKSCPSKHYSLVELSESTLSERSAMDISSITMTSKVGYSPLRNSTIIGPSLHSSISSTSMILVDDLSSDSSSSSSFILPEIPIIETVDSSPLENQTIDQQNILFGIENVCGSLSSSNSSVAIGNPFSPTNAASHVYQEYKPDTIQSPVRRSSSQSITSQINEVTCPISCSNMSVTKNRKSEPNQFIKNACETGIDVIQIYPGFSQFSSPRSLDNGEISTSKDLIFFMNYLSSFVKYCFIIAVLICTIILLVSVGSFDLPNTRNQTALVNDLKSISLYYQSIAALSQFSHSFVTHFIDMDHRFIQTLNLFHSSTVFSEDSTTFPPKYYPSDLVSFNEVKQHAACAFSKLEAFESAQYSLFSESFGKGDFNLVKTPPNSSLSLNLMEILSDLIPLDKQLFNEIASIHILSDHIDLDEVIKTQESRMEQTCKW
ncbi:hypothetical protein ADUPG1_005957, partial [Aduncisulcus paluster]